jgi:uncharacterized protein DUF4339
MSDGWHYVHAGQTIGPLDLKQMQTVLSQISDPRNLLVWKAGLKDWQRAEVVPELAAVIQTPPPLPKMNELPRGLNMPEGAWRDAVAISLCIAMAGLTGGIFAALGMLPVAVALDWATRRRRDFARTIASTAHIGPGSGQT